jgi:hypothetical protein
MRQRTEETRAASQAFRFVLAMGVVNLFADMTYEGGASINGPFLGTLGASAAAVSIIAGVGEFLGYSLRSVVGYVSDKTERYWLVTFIGYCVNLLAYCRRPAGGQTESGVRTFLRRIRSRLVGRQRDGGIAIRTITYSPDRIFRHHATRVVAVLFCRAKTESLKRLSGK